MRKIFAFIMTTLDGYYEGPNQEFDYWANTRLITADVADEVTKLKERPGKDIAILGSSDLAASLLQTGLVDEVRIMVNPVVLGAGKSVFRTAGERISLKLVKSRPFDSGNVLLHYQPAAR